MEHAATGLPDFPDWLALHGLRADQLPAILPQTWPGMPPAADDPPFASKNLLTSVLTGLSTAQPDLRGALDDLNRRALINLNPDPQRFPRAFTLRDAGNGAPYISLPARGRLSDLIILAHEIGHALQARATATDLPPVYRETAAYLAERACVKALAVDRRFAGLGPLMDRRRARTLRRCLPALDRAARAPGAVYDYDWNYPPALWFAAALDADGQTAAALLGDMPALAGYLAARRNP